MAQMTSFRNPLHAKEYFWKKWIKLQKSSFVFLLILRVSHHNDYFNTWRQTGTKNILEEEAVQV